MEEAAINSCDEKTDINVNLLNKVTGEVTQYFHEAVMNFFFCHSYAKFAI